jgi:hypothetical protein
MGGGKDFLAGATVKRKLRKWKPKQGLFAWSLQIRSILEQLFFIVKGCNDVCTDFAHPYITNPA